MTDDVSAEACSLPGVEQVRGDFITMHASTKLNAQLRNAINDADEWHCLVAPGLCSFSQFTQHLDTLQA